MKQVSLCSRLLKASPASREGTHASATAAATEQLREEVLGVHAAAHTTHAALKTGLSRLVVYRPLLGVRQDLVTALVRIRRVREREARVLVST